MCHYSIGEYKWLCEEIVHELRDAVDDSGKEDVESPSRGVAFVCCCHDGEAEGRGGEGPQVRNEVK